MKDQLNVRISPETRHQLNELVIKNGESEGQVIARLIDRECHREGKMFGIIVQPSPGSSHVELSDGKAVETRAARRSQLINPNLVLIRANYNTGMLEMSRGGNGQDGGEGCDLPYPLTRGHRSPTESEWNSAPEWAKEAYLYYRGN